MFSQASVILSTVRLIDTRSLLVLVTTRSVRILLEWFLVGIRFQSPSVMLLQFCQMNQKVFYGLS